MAPIFVTASTKVAISSPNNSIIVSVVTPSQSSTVSCKRPAAIVVGVAFVIELDDLKGREKFKDIPVCALTHFEGE